MSDNTDTKVSNYSNKWTEWIEEAIEKEHLRYYEYKNFTNIEVIGFGGFGKVYRANRNNSHQYFALKCFSKLDDATVEEIVHEVVMNYKAHLLYPLLLPLYLDFIFYLA
jgi:hypothetical protein